MQTPKQVLSEIEKGKAKPVYYLFGEEPFKIAEFVEKAKKAIFGEETNLTFSVDRIDGATATGSDVLDAIQSMGLFGGGSSDGRRLVIVRTAHLLKEIDPLAHAVMDAGSSSPWGDSLLLLLGESLDGRKKFHQWLKKHELALEFRPARDAELAQWVQYLAKKTGAKIGPDAQNMLALLSDGSLYRLASELEKAWLYASARVAESGEPVSQPIEVLATDIAAVCGSQISHEMIELVRAVLEAKRTRALLLAEKLIHGQDDALGLVGFLTWAIKNPGRGFTGQVAGGVARARQMIQALLDLDLRLKSSGMDANALIEQFVIEQTATISK